MSKLNVLFIASSKRFGLTFNLTRLAVALKKAGNNIIAVTKLKDQEEGLFEELTVNNIKCYRIHHLDDFSIKNTMPAIKKLGEIIKTNDVDVIHAQGVRHMLIAFLASKIFCRKEKIGIVVSIHSTLHGRSQERMALLAESFLLNICADIAMPVTNITANRLVDYGLLPSKVKTVYNGIDLKVLNDIIHTHECSSLLPDDFKSSSNVVIGYFAKMLPWKGHEHLIEAISKVAEKFPSVRLVLTEDGPRRDKLESLCRSIDIEKKVLFTGRIEYRLLYRLLKRIDIYAFPSTAELFPFALLEAMAAGKPIVATNVGGIPEAVIDGMNGYIVPPRDPTSLSKAILKLISDFDRAKEFGEKSRALIEEKFDLLKIAHDITKCYELALCKGGDL